MVREFDLDLADGRTLHAYDTGGSSSADQSAELAVFWQHGTPNLGSPPEPLFAVAERLGIRWVSHDRPAYGGSTPIDGRNIGSVASDVAAVADALGIEQFAVMGHSGGGPHALACAALLPERVRAVVSVSGIAPYGAAGLDWFDGMADSGVASLRAALAGRTAKQRHESSGAEGEIGFDPDDWAALEADWAWLGGVAGAASRGGPEGLIADDLAYVAPWGFEPRHVEAPTLLVHGGADRVIPCAHSEWLAKELPKAELWVTPGAGHISILERAVAAVEWLHAHA